jgi:transcriptional regulator with XRE-family HTH domain
MKQITIQHKLYGATQLTVSVNLFRAARALAGWSQQELAMQSQVSRSVIATFEMGTSTPQPRVMAELIRAFERAGIVFYDAIPGERGSAVGFKWGMEPPLRTSGEGEAAGEEGEGGIKAAWDDFEGDADLDALLSEAPGLNPDMAEYWRTAPALWASLSEGGRETLSRSMYGDTRAAGEGYFRNSDGARP